MTFIPKTEEDAVKRIAEIQETARAALKEIMDIADAHGLHVELFHEWDNYLSYHGRPYLYSDCEIREEGGWYHSTCS